MDAVTDPPILEPLMKSTWKYPLAAMLLAVAALGGCETEESLRPQLEEEPVEMEPQYNMQGNAGKVFVPSSWGVGRECMRTSDLADFLEGYNLNELDAANRNKVEMVVYLEKRNSISNPTPKEMHPTICVHDMKWHPAPLESK